MESTFNLDFASNLMTYRKRQKISQGKLARMVGVSRQTISNWERGDMHPDVLYFVKLAEALNITVNDLVRGRGVA